MEVLLKARIRVVFTNAIANEDLRKKLDSLKISLDNENKDILSISGAEISSDNSITCIVIVLSKTERTYDLQTYIQKIQSKVSEAVNQQPIKLIDISIM